MANVGPLLVVSLLLCTQQPPRLPIPSGADVKKAEKTIRELFKADYMKTARADRVVLGQKLLEAGKGTKNDPVIRYTLLLEAEGCASVHGDLKTAFAAIDELAGSYEVDADARKAVALAEAKRSSALLEAAVDLTQFMMERANSSAAKELYDEALKWADEAKAVVRGVRDPALPKEVALFASELAEMRREYVIAKKALDTLSGNTDDPEANTSYGKYASLLRGEWEKGCRLIAKGIEGPLKEAGKAELGGLATPEGALEKGESWLLTAGKESGLYKRRAIARCRFWLQNSLSSAAGITRVRMDRRLDDLDQLEFGASVINVAKLFTPKHSVEGAWKNEQSGILSPLHAGGVPHKAAVPYLPADEYDLHILLESREGGHCGVGLVLPVGGPVVVHMDAQKTFLGEVEGKNFTSNLGAVAKGKVYSLHIAVRRSWISVRLDGAQVLDWRGDFKRLAPAGIWGIPGKSLYLLSGGSFLFSRIVHVQVTGAGKPLRP